MGQLNFLSDNAQEVIEELLKQADEHIQERHVATVGKRELKEELELEGDKFLVEEMDKHNSGVYEVLVDRYWEEIRSGIVEKLDHDPPGDGYRRYLSQFRRLHHGKHPNELADSDTIQARCNRDGW